MSATEHKGVFRRLIEEGFNDGCLAALDELLTTSTGGSPSIGAKTPDLMEQLGITVT